MKPLQLLPRKLSIIAFVLFFISTVAYSQDRTADSTALVALYNNMGGASWSNSDGWPDTGTIDTWFGVSFDGTRVVSLSLGANNLTGTVPIEIGNLDALQQLYLNENQITSIPDEIGNLVSLSDLVVGDNLITALPAGLGNLDGLVFLDAGDNQLTTIPNEISNLINLTTLELDYNQITSLPTVIDGLTALTDLQLDGNQLSTLPVELFNISSLRILDLAENQFTTVPTGIDGLAFLESLDFGDNQLSGAFPAEVLLLDSLRELNLGRNQLTGAIPAGISNFTKLIQLTLDQNQFTGNIPTTINSLSFLEIFEVGNNQLSGNIPTEVGTLDSLRFLDLSVNGFTGALPASFTGLANLETLVINDNSLTGLPDLTSLTDLNEVYLSGNLIPEADLLTNQTILDSNINQEQFITAAPFTYNVSSSTFGYSTLSAPTTVTLSDDSVTSTAIPIGFDFDFFGATYNSIYISSNGFISFQSPDQDADGNPDEEVDGCCRGHQIPLSLYPNAYIAGYWEDLDPSQGGTIQYENLGSEFIVEFSNVPHLDEAIFVSFQIKLIQGSNEIEIHCQSCPPDPDSDVTTQGIEDSLGFQGFNFAGRSAAEFDLTSDAVLFQPEAAQVIPTSDSLALVALYDSTNGDFWNDNANWKTGSPDTWFGVTVTNGRVTEINLQNNGLQGTLPPQIGDLDSLEILLLSDYPALAGSLPTEIGNLSVLTSLYLEGNFTGDWPSTIGNLTSLESLFLFSDQITGGYHSSWGNLVNLTSFEVNSGQMTGPIPPEFVNLVSLQSLILTLPEGEIPTFFGDYTNLHTLSISGSNNTSLITGNIPAELGNLTLLTDLWITGLPVSGSIPLEIFNLPSLSNLTIHNTDITGGIPSEIGNLSSSLSILDLAFNYDLGGQLPPEIWNLALLDQLVIESNNITDTIPPEIGNLTNLIYLNLSGNQLNGEIPSEIGNLTFLQGLNLSNNDLEGSIPASFINLNGLLDFHIQNNLLTDLPDLSSLASLNNFNIYNNLFGFDDIIPNTSPPGFSGSPQILGDIGFDTVLVQGDNLTIDLSAFGNTSGNVYQWRLDGADISGENTQTLSFTNATKSIAGEYQLIITNPSAPGIQLESQVYSVQINNTYYWVGDGGDWYDTLHWSQTSGVVDPNGLIPDLYDNVFFDENSFTQSGQVVEIPDLGNQAGANVSNMDWTGVTNNPTFRIRADSSPWIVNNLRGSLIFDENMTLDFHHAEIYFNSPTDYVLDSKGHYMGEDCFMTFGYNGGTGEERFPSTCNILSDVNNILLFAVEGRVNANGFRIIGQPNHYFWLSGIGNPTVDISNSEVDLGYMIIQAGELIDDDATIIIRDPNGTRSVSQPTDFNHVVAADTIELGGSNTYQTLEILPGAGVRLQADSTQFINNLIANGTNDLGIFIGSTVDSLAGTFSKPAGEVNIQFATIENNIATGGATFNAIASLDSGNVSGWNFIPKTPVVAADSLALVAIYDSLGGDSWTNNSQWKTGPVQSWFGVKVSGDRVVGVDLSNNNFANGILPPSIGDLTALDVLNLRDNSIFGPIPSEIGNIVALDSLILANTFINDTIPIEIGNLSTLVYLDLNNCSISSIPTEITNLDSLDYLDIANNQLQDLPDLTAFTSLSFFNVSGNNLTFEDLDVNSAIPGISYTPQNQVGSDSLAALAIGESGTLITQIQNYNGNNSYQWYKDATLIPDETNPTLTAPSWTLADEGVYFLEATNPAVPGLTLNSGLFTVFTKDQSQFTWINNSLFVEEGLSGGGSYGAAIGDYDNDGLDDLFTLNLADIPSYLYRNLGGGTFERTSSAIPNGEDHGAYGSAWGDYNNDGFLDLFVADVQFSASVTDGIGSIYRNNGNGTFTSISLGETIYGAAWGDVDNDGLLDAAANVGADSIFIYMNVGTDTLVKQTAVADISTNGGTVVPFLVDLTGDGYVDLYFTGSVNGLYFNDGAGNFVEQSTNALVTTTFSGPWGASFEDLDNDGDIDAFIRSYLPGEDSYIFTNDGVGNFTGTTCFDLFGEACDRGRGSALADVNNDGYVDVIFNEGSPTDTLEIYLNNANTGYNQLTGQNFLGTLPAHGISVFDYDNDGYLDIYSPSSFNLRANMLYQNNGAGNNWLKVKLEGIVSNRSGVGAEVSVYAGGLRTSRSVITNSGLHSGASNYLHFGLGGNVLADSIIVNWPSGIINKEIIVSVNQTLNIVEDVTPPVVTVDVLGTSISSPEITGTIDDLGATLELTINGSTYLVPTINADSSWSLPAGTIAPDLPDGVYDVEALATDANGNEGVDDLDGELTITQELRALIPSKITSSSFQANWSEALDVQEYLLDVATDSEFTTFVEGYENFSTTLKREVIDSLDFSTTYYYRVRFVNTADETSPYSNDTTALTKITQATISDFNALEAIFNATGGENWINDGGWTTEPRLQDWEFIALENQRVAEIVMPGNNLTGTFPLTDSLTKVRLIDLSDNALTGIDSLTKLEALVDLDVSQNLFGFDDLEPLRTVQNFNYSDQKTRISFSETAEADSLLIDVFFDAFLTVDVGGTFNTYHWSRNKSSITSNEQFAIQDSSLQIISIDYNNMGKFEAEVRNDSLPDLTLRVDSMFVFAVADFTVDVNDADGELIPDEVDGYLLLTTQVDKGFDTLDIAKKQPSSFTFEDVILGNYLISIDSDPAKYVPTYYADAFEWIEADTVLFRKDTAFQVSMTIIPDPLDPNSGVGTLEVVIEEDFGDDNARIDARRRAAKRKCGLRRKTGGGRTGQDDDEFVLIAYGETDENGEFKFGFLPEGTYRFFVEYPGIPINESSFVQFVVGEQGISDTDFKLEAFASEDGIEVTIERVLGLIFEYFKNLEVYPNPTTDVLKMSYRHLTNKAVAAQLVDLLGNVLWSKDVRTGYDGYEEIDVSNFREGIYLLNIYDKEDSKGTVVSYRVIIRRK
jgi:Leucine-rich repeat (LRR) protein